MEKLIKLTENKLAETNRLIKKFKKHMSEREKDLTENIQLVDRYSARIEILRENARKWYEWLRKYYKHNKQPKNKKQVHTTKQGKQRVRDKYETIKKQISNTSKEDYDNILTFNSSKKLKAKMHTTSIDLFTT